MMNYALKFKGLFKSLTLIKIVLVPLSRTTNKAKQERVNNLT